MHKVYRSRSIGGLGLVVSLAHGNPFGCVSLLLIPSKDGLPNVWIGLGMLAMAAFMVWILFSSITSSRRTTCWRAGSSVAGFPWTKSPRSAVPITRSSSPALSLTGYGSTTNDQVAGRGGHDPPKEKDHFHDDLARSTGWTGSRSAWCGEPNDARGAKGLHPMMKYLLWFLGILLTVIGISGNPMLLIFPMWIFTYLNREFLRRLVKSVPFSVRSLALACSSDC